MIINAKIKTQCALKDALEPVGSPAVMEKSMVSNLPLRVVHSLLTFCGARQRGIGGIVRGKVSIKLIVYFEEPFWVGVFEKIEGGKLSVAKVTFGAEPKDYDVYGIILKYYYRLQFSPAVAAVVREQKKNPKRMQRDVNKQIQEKGIGTKSQQALKLQQEQNKQERITKNRERKELEKQRMFELKQQKKREKHKGH